MTLDTTHTDTVADIVLDVLEETGYNDESAIAGLVKAIQIIAKNDDDLLDEAVGLLE
jgi:hypothetical protein